MFTKWLTGDSSAPKRRARGKTMALAVLLSAALAGCSLLPNEMEEEQIPDIQPPKLSEKPTYTVQTGTIVNRVRGNGKIMSLQEETLFFSMEGSYRVKDVYVQTGQQVQAGDLIAELDVQQLVDELRLEEINFREQELNMKRTLRNTEGLSPEDLELKKIQFEKARLSLVKKREQIERAKITAPFSGTIVSVSVKPGDTPQAYAPVAVIADTSRLTVAVEIKSKNDLAQIAVGMEAEVDINAAGSHKGKVSRLPVETNDNNNSYNPWDPWNPGGGQQKEDSLDKYVLIELDEFPEGVTRATPRKENVVVIPPSTLRTYGGRTYVQVVEEDGTKREVDVEVGQQTSTQVEIVNGLEPGMKVVGK